MSRVSFSVMRPLSLGTICSPAPRILMCSSFSRAKASELTIWRGYPFTAQTSAQVLRRRLRRFALQLGFIGGTKRVPRLRLGMEALAQRVARRDVPEPEIDPGLVPGDAARP